MNTKTAEITSGPFYPGCIEPYISSPTTTSIPCTWPLNVPAPFVTELQQCIKDCLRLATFAGPSYQPELDRLARKIEAQVQKELDAWKALMGGEAKSTEPARDMVDCNIYHSDVFTQLIPKKKKL